MWWQVSVPATYAVKYGDLTAQDVGGGSCGLPVRG